METFLIKTVQLILALSILVIFHEFGHYSFARIFGVKVEKFYLFFDPWFALFRYKPSKKKTNSSISAEKEAKINEESEENASWRDTEYGIGWLPLGGYVKIAGMIDESMDTEQLKQPAKKWEFRSKPAYQRLMIMVAGVVFNFILAVIIYAAIAFNWGEEYIPFENAFLGMKYSELAQSIGYKDGDIPLYADDVKLDHLTSESLQQIIEAKNVKVLRNGVDTINISVPENFMLTLLSDKKAEKEKFMSYRVPVVIESSSVGSGAEKAGLQKNDKIIAVGGVSSLSYDLFVNELNKYKDQDVKISFLRNGAIDSVMVHTTSDAKLGVMLQQPSQVFKTKIQNYSIFESVPKGIENGVEKLKSYVSSFKYVFTAEGAQSLGGFGAIGSIFPDVWDWESFWSLTAFLSVILAFMNILPIPALDGGHVMFLLYELITRRQPNQKFMEYAQMAGMIFLLLLLLYANGNDVFRFFFK